jgi:hypothetical protein
MTIITVLTALILSVFSFKTKSSLGKLSISFFTFLFGVFLVTSPVVLWLYSSGTLNEFLYLGFVKAPEISKILSPGFHPLKVLFAPNTPSNLYQIFGLLFYPIYFLIYIFTGGILLKEMSRQKKLSSETMPLVVLFLFGILLIPYGTSVIEIGHLVKAGIPAFLLGAYLIQKEIHSNTFRIYKYIFLIPPLVFLLGSIGSSLWWIRFNDKKVDLNQGLIYLNSISMAETTHPTEETLKQTLAFIERNTQKTDYIFVAPYHAMIYFLSERRDPSKFDNFAAGYVSDSEEEAIIKNMEEKNVQIIVYDSNFGVLGKKMSNYNPKIHKYIMSNFEVIENTKDNWLLMKRKR